MRARGWIYDAYQEDDHITLWMRTDDSQVLKLRDTYTAELFATPTRQTADEQVAVLSEHPLVQSAFVCLRYHNISDARKSETVKLTAKPSDLRKLIWDLEQTGICRLYNIDLNPAQRYFFRKNLNGSGLFTVECGENLRALDLAQEDCKDTPPLDIQELNFNSPDEQATRQLIESFQILAVPRDQRPAFYAFLRRDRVNSWSPRPLPSKVIIDSETYRTLGVAGLHEKGRFAFLPIGVVANWGPARTIDSRQCYEAIRQGILIPSTRSGTRQNVLTAKEVAYTDRGSLILSPKVGLHENVAELDFEALFPSIIVKHNISYETVSAGGIDSSRKGLLPDVVGQFIQRRLIFKHQKSELPEDSNEWKECDQRDQILKKLLVCIFGYSGSDLNRFGNVFAYREVNRIGRETVVASMNAALREGYEVIYLDTDSIFVKKQDANTDDFLNLALKVTKETGFQVALAHHYRYLVLLTQEADPDIEASRRYYGKLTDGRVFYRGIELRRHDYPVFLKKYQQKLLDLMLEAESAPDITRMQYEKAVQLAHETLDRIQSGNLPVSEMTISKVLRMPIERYCSLFPHVVAAVQLRANHKPVKPGDMVDYVYLDAQQVNPLRRVAPAEFASSYDPDKYGEMLLDVTESILGVFGFSRTQLGFQRRPRNFLEELRGERAKEILLELEDLQDAITNVN